MQVPTSAWSSGSSDGPEHSGSWADRSTPSCARPTSRGPKTPSSKATSSTTRSGRQRSARGRRPRARGGRPRTRREAVHPARGAALPRTFLLRPLTRLDARFRPAQPASGELATLTVRLPRPRNLVVLEVLPFVPRPRILRRAPPQTRQNGWQDQQACADNACARHDSNVRPQPPQGCALSPELRAPGRPV